MTLAPNDIERLARARADLRMGVPVVLSDGSRAVLAAAVETVGDVSGITKGGAGREATDKEIQGATYADGLGTAISGLFGALPNTSFSQNVGLIALTGVMSRGVVTIGAVLAQAAQSLIEFGPK